MVESAPAAEAIRAEEVVFDYPGPLRAVDGVSLEVTPGELTAVLGPNGSGKTTLVRLLAGVLVPGRGSVTLAGGAVHAMTPRERARRIAVVPQLMRSLPDVTVEEFVLGGRYGHLGRWRRAHVHDRDAVRGALARAGATGEGGRLLTELSGGQRQRVLVARALAQEARLLLVDEPTTSLDFEHQLRVFELLAQLVEDGCGACVVTHDLNLASQFATRLVLLAEGRVRARGTADEVLCEGVLGPVYGRHLAYGRLATPDGRGRPFVLPWLQ